MLLKNSIENETVEKRLFIIKTENSSGFDFYDNYLIQNFFGYGPEEQLSPRIKNFISEMLATKCKISLT